MTNQYPCKPGEMFVPVHKIQDSAAKWAAERRYQLFDLIADSFPSGSRAFLDLTAAFAAEAHDPCFVARMTDELNAVLEKNVGVGLSEHAKHAGDFGHLAISSSVSRG